MRTHPEPDHLRPHPITAGMARKTGLTGLVIVVFLLLACSGDQPDSSSQAKPSENSVPPPAVEHHLPEFFPEQITLPDQYLIVRNESRISQQHGRDIAMNIALPGSVAEWRERYEAVLEQNFTDIEFIEDHASLQWRFRGQGFDYGVLYLNANRGYLDRGQIDSTHLPVMLTLTMTEHRD